MAASDALEIVGGPGDATAAVGADRIEFTFDDWTHQLAIPRAADDQRTDTAVAAIIAGSALLLLARHRFASGLAALNLPIAMLDAAAEARPASTEAGRPEVAGTDGSAGAAEAGVDRPFSPPGAYNPCLAAGTSCNVLAMGDSITAGPAHRTRAGSGCRCSGRRALRDSR